MTFCCESFAAEVKSRPHEGIEQDDDGSWNVNGCCHGGCYVLSGMKFCPFCGTALPGKEASPEVPT